MEKYVHKSNGMLKHQEEEIMVQHLLINGVTVEIFRWYKSKILGSGRECVTIG